MNFKNFTAGKKLQNKLFFVRYGDLSPVKQLGYGNASFHAPPAKKGVYAFPWPYIEMFLITVDDRGTGKLSPRFAYVKDKQGNKISNRTHPKQFDHHYGNKCYTYSPSQDIAIKAARLDPDNEELNKATYFDQHEHFAVRLRPPKIFKYEGDLWHHLNVGGLPIKGQRGSWTKTDISIYKAALKKELHNVKVNRYSKDHLEVFIERI